MDNNDKQQLQDFKRSIDMPALLTGYGVDLKKQGASYVALCIWHDEKRPSMSVFQGDDGIWRCNCHSCGQRGTAIDVVQEMDGVDLAEAIQRLKKNHFIRDEKRIKAEAPIVAAKWKHQKPPEPLTDFTLPGLTYVAHWEYRDLDHSLLGYVARYFDKDGNKEYRPWTFGTMAEAIKPAWKCRAFSNPRPLYGLHKLTSGANDKRIVMTEGEKTADAAQKLLPGMISIGWPGGANAIAHIDWQQLAGRNVLLVPDADPAGEKAMYDAARYLLAIGCTVRLLDTSDKIYVKKGWDLADALEEGWTTDDIKTFCEDRITTLTSREIEAEAARRLERESEEKKTVEIATASIPDDMPPSATLIEGEPVRVEEIPSVDDTPPNVVPIRPHTGIESKPIDAPEFSDIHLAEIWSRNDGQDWLFCNGWNKWLQWDGARWEVDQRQHCTRAVANEMKRATYWLEANQLSISQKRGLCSVKNVANVLKAASWLPEHGRIADDFDADHWLLGTPSGTVDLRTGKMREPERADMITKQTAVAPAHGPMPHWDMVLDRCTMGDPEMREYYQKWAFYALTGDTREQAFLFVHGKQASGKTVFLSTLSGMLGDYAKEIDIAILMENKHGVSAAPHDLAELAGVRLAMCTEPTSGQRWNEGLVKKMTGSERIQACRKYENPFTFKPQFKIFMGGNDKPSLTSADGMERRLHIAEFPETIPEAKRIQNLPEQLQAEWPAILQWAIDGRTAWFRDGLKKPAAVAAAVAEYVDAQDIIGEWLSERTEAVRDGRVRQTELYENYAVFVKGLGQGVLGSARLVPELKKRGYIQGRSGGIRYWYGLQLRTEFPAHHETKPESWTASFDDNGF